MLDQLHIEALIHGLHHFVCRGDLRCLWAFAQFWHHRSVVMLLRTNVSALVLHAVHETRSVVRDHLVEALTDLRAAGE